MINTNPTLQTIDQRPWYSWLFLVLYVFIGVFVGQFFGLLAILPFYDFDINDALFKLLDTEEGNSRIPLLVLQGVSSVCGFILAPWYFLRRFTYQSVGGFFAVSDDLRRNVLIVFGITISFMFVNSIFIEWNKDVTFPEALSWFEEFAREKELMAEKLTKFLTTFPDTGTFLLAMFVIALIPAFGEELLFRGLVQNLLGNSTKNPHVAIWVAAFLFSAFHMQFFGFVPRMLLGALFGYLYYWSGSLLYAIVGHFVNNGFTILMLYLYQNKLIDFDIEGTESTPIPIVLGFFVLGTFLCYLFIKQAKNNAHLTDG